jgi:4-amino-4-deoxy-L-arabinose transferase-like glycosyltransferase
MTELSSPSDPSSRIGLVHRDSRWIALLLTLLGLVLRLWGITWSLPNRQHLYSYHPDEILVLWASHSADVWSGHFNPHFYNYGTAPIYLFSLFRPLAYALLTPGIYTDYLLGRTLTAILGAATVYLTFRLADRAGGPWAGGIAGAFMAVAPAHVMHSHYVTVDVPATFWITLCLYASIGYVQAAKTKSLILAGIAAGLAAGTKYNAGVVLLSVLAACVLSRLKEKRANDPQLRSSPLLNSLGTAMGAFLLAFLASTPGILFWTREFWRDFHYELQHTRTGHGLVFVGTSPGWWFHWTTNLYWGLGLPLLLLVSAGLVAVLWTLARAWRLSQMWEAKTGNWPRIQEGYLVLLAFLIPYYLVIGGAEVKFLRYTIPLIPPLLVLLGCEGAKWMGRSSVPPTVGDAEEKPGIRKGWGLLFAGVWLYTALYTLSFASLYSKEPPQDQAADWLQSHAVGHTLGLTTVPWFYSPPVSPYNGGPQSAPDFYRNLADSPYRLVVLSNDLNRLAEAGPEFVVLSDFEIRDALRLSKEPNYASRPDVQPVTRFLQAVQQDYQPVQTLQNRPAFLPAALLPGGLPPHDWLYPYPALTIWKRK